MIFLSESKLFFSYRYFCRAKGTECKSDLVDNLFRVFHLKFVSRSNGSILRFLEFAKKANPATKKMMQTTQERR